MKGVLLIVKGCRVPKEEGRVILSVVKTIYRDRVVFKRPFDNTICPEIIQSRFQYPNCVQRSKSCTKFGFGKFLNGKRKYSWNRKELVQNRLNKRGIMGSGGIPSKVESESL